MRKSPLSTPRGNRSSTGWNSSPSPGSGYNRNSQEFQSPQRNQVSLNISEDDDFIPLSSTQVSSNRNSNESPRGRGQSPRGSWQSPRGSWQSPRGQWQSPRGPWRGSPGRGTNQHRQNSSPGFYHNERDNFRQPSSSYRDGGRQFYGQQKRNNTRRKPDISQYLNLESFLEDPWAELMSTSITETTSNNSSLNLSFSNKTRLSDTHLDDSTKVKSVESRKRKSGEVGNDSHLESDDVLVQRSQESPES